MGDLWVTYGRPMGDLWATYGRPMGDLWNCSDESPREKGGGRGVSDTDSETDLPIDMV